MLRRKFSFLISCFILFCCCGQNKSGDNNVDTTANTKTVSFKDYIDFKYSKVIAFATVNPFDFLNGMKGGHVDISGFRDTISMTLDRLQILLLNDVLSGRKGMRDDSSRVADCFYPRHNIVFVDSNGLALNYISICFECGKIKATKSTGASLESLDDFFNSIGLPVFDNPTSHKNYYDSIAKARYKIKK